MLLAFGEIMMRVAPPGFLRFRQALPGPVDVVFGGGEANVAVSLATLGADAVFLTALPRNAIADAGSDDGLREFQRGVVERAMAQAPEAWNDRLKAAIERAGWDLGEFTEAIRQRQAAGAEVDVAEVVRFLTDASTAIEARSWGQVKREITEQR